ncbi:hypothetical protein HNQ94_003499 [Salirhabdus euzebyi]|uniref:DUF7147 domain-containing protein n=1 Tax=Salirhabdus euzebyi TaxID=394506 RepID=A0A841Q9F5_9BACI|nr:methylthioribose kinase [Salirhabdus euzebyi]MBB6455005.1 hypothetical protein [Salirhabdus euzebyi]
MIQKFIPLGEGYADFYELLTLGKTMSNRVKHFIAFHSTKKDESKTSIAIVMNPTDPGKFQPIYICLEGIPSPSVKASKRYEMFEKLAEEQHKKVISIQVQPSSHFGERELYFQYLIAILRTNHYIAPLQ